MIVLLLPLSTGFNVRPRPLYDLLVQRAVQTCCFTSRQCRDNPTAQWLEQFAGHSGLEHFHGLDGLRMAWDEYLTKLLYAPEQSVMVQSVLKKHRGLSPNNPYLQPTPMEYEHRIVPSQIAERVMQTACDIASEWTHDLGLMEAENAEQTRRHLQAVRTGAGDDERNTTLPVFAVDPVSPDADSPYRGGNYDLLKLLATRHATRSLLRDCEAQAARRRTFEFLQRFAEARELSGEQPYHAADEWLAELLDQPPLVVMPDAADGGGGLIDPHELAEEVMRRRVGVATAWRDELSSVPEQMLGLKRAWLDAMSESASAD